MRNYETFYIVRPGDSLSKVAQKTFGSGSSDTLRRQIAELQQGNPHIKDPARIQPGQFLALGLTGIPASLRSPYAQDLNELSVIWRQTPDAEKQIVAHHWDLLQAIEAGQTHPPSHSLPAQISKSFIEKLIKGGENFAEISKENLMKLGMVELAPAAVIDYYEILKGKRREALGFVNRNRARAWYLQLTPNAQGLYAHAQKLKSLVRLASLLKAGGLILSAYELRGDIAEINAYQTMRGRDRATMETAGKMGGAAVGGALTLQICTPTVLTGAGVLVCGAIVGTGISITTSAIGKRALGAAYPYAAPFIERYRERTKHISTLGPLPLYYEANDGI